MFENSLSKQGMCVKEHVSPLNQSYTTANDFHMIYLLLWKHLG